MKLTDNKAPRLLQWRTLGSGLLALTLLFTGVSASASSIGLVTSSSGSLEITSDLNVIGGDAAGGAHATVIAPDLQVCDERTAMVSRFDATGDLQVCKETGAVDANGNPIWDWMSHQVVGSNIATGAVGETQIANDAVAQQHVRADAVGGDQIRTSSITGLKLIENAIQSRELASNAVGTTHIAANAVTNAKIASGAVGTSQLANNAVTSANIAAFAVTTDKIGGGAVTNAKIAYGAVRTASLADGAVTNAKLAKIPSGCSVVYFKTSELRGRTSSSTQYHVSDGRIYGRMCVAMSTFYGCNIWSTWYDSGSAIKSVSCG